VSAWWWFSSSLGTSATTTATWASNQSGNIMHIVSVGTAGNASLPVAIPGWTTTAVPYIQAVGAADSTAPSSTTQHKTVTLAALKTGHIITWGGRAAAAISSTAATGWLEDTDDSTGSSPDMTVSSFHLTTPSTSISTNIMPATFSASQTLARAEIAIELVPQNFIVCMVSGIEIQ
jgi:hypothetical protein